MTTKSHKTTTKIKLVATKRHKTTTKRKIDRKIKERPQRDTKQPVGEETNDYNETQNKQKRQTQRNTKELQRDQRWP